MPALPTLHRLLVVSPHLDDGVFSCGQLLAAHPGSHVLTVFAGVPPPEVALTEWDAQCGFDSSEQAMASRHHEDREALARLGARPVWLSFLDSQYGRTPAATEIEAALRPAVEALAPDAVLLPMGLFHSDHALVHDACLRLMRRGTTELWLAYEDALYRRMPGLLQQRLAALGKAGICATPATPARTGALSAKQRAVQAYASQLRAFGPSGHADTEAPERLWQLSLPAPARMRQPARDTAQEEEPHAAP